MSFDSFEHMLWWVFVGSRGGRTRMTIVNSLLDNPANAYQLTKTLSLNYRTILHHLELLEENRIVQGEGPKYGKVYFPTALLMENLQIYRKVTGLNIGAAED